MQQISIADGAMRPWPGLAPLATTHDTGGRRPSRLFWFDSAPGRRDLPVIVLIHGLGDEADSFRHLFPLLASRFRVLAADLPGFGRSRTAGPTTLGLCVEAQLAMMDVAGIGSALLVGSSLGAAIAESLAFARSERVEGLVFLDGGLPMGGGTGPGLLSMALPLVGSRRYTALRSDHGAAVASLAPYYADFAALPEADRDFLAERVVDRVESDTQRRAYLSLIRSAIGTVALRGADFARGLAAWKKPLLVVWGSKDRVISPESGRALARLVPGARFAGIDAAGHLPHQERPAEVAALLADLKAR